ncbi:MAG: NAD-dependent epimerase/dehydratase family protein, partial [Acidimicrobiales bacterium]
VYHVAGVNQFCLRDPSPMRRANVTGSLNVVEAAAAAGAGRLVYTSSAVVLGEEHGTVGREDSAHRGTFISEYERSKYDAERAVLRRAGQLGLDVVCVNPSSVQGPGRATGTGEVLLRYLRGRLKLWIATTVSLVDIDDCAKGHLRAEAKGQSGERYVLNGATLESDDLLRIMRAVAPGVAPPRLAPPVTAAIAVRVVEAVGRVRRRTPVVCRESLRALMHGHRYDGTRAERELGLTYRPAAETLRRTAEWLVAEGLAPASALG